LNRLILNKKQEVLKKFQAFNAGLFLWQRPVTGPKAGAPLPNNAAGPKPAGLSLKRLRG
jgi:hypothetical protein